MATIATLTGTVVAASAPTDVEADGTAAVNGNVNIQIPRIGHQGGFLEFPLSSATILASVTVGATCTITITQ